MQHLDSSLTPHPDWAGRSRRHAHRTVGVALALLTVGATSATAQRVRGRLLDVESDQPITAGVLTLLSARGASVTTVLSDNEGAWALEVPGPGVYYVSAKRIGYSPWLAGPLRIERDDDLNSVFRLRPLPIVLDPVEVSAKATHRYLESAGFYDRQHANFGHFMAPEDIAKRHATAVTDLLSGIPGVTLGSLTEGSVGPRYVQLRGSDLSRGGLCRPRVFVDGLLYAYGDARPKRDTDDASTERIVEDQLLRIDQGVSLDDIGHPSTIAAIEVYRSASQVPVEFGGTSTETQCGVIIVWTRTGNMRAPK